ncbi:MAG: hypothetical protein AAGF01_16965 [Cyanobacteria bacterium P01_G01_bin.38]
MSDAVLSQLVEAEAQLASQETQLIAQISAIQGQRQGLQTVIDMFQSPANSNGATLSLEALDEVVTVAKTATKTTPKKTTRKAKTPTQAKKTTTKRATKAPAAKAKATATKTKTAATKTLKEKTPRKAPAARKAKPGKAPNWQRYVQEPFRKSALPDVVANILNAQPEQVFKIAEIMEAIFKSDMPKATFLKARNRVSNILSAGARNGDWGRGRGGTYSMSKSALPK